MTIAAKATVTSTRQPIAARRVNQLGTFQMDWDGGGAFGVVSKRQPYASRVDGVRNRSP